ncbi:MAG: molybdopterin-dependent oxidoreductase [Acidobacteria bacterium]|nr:molybdopterin-dependent oxidoreductase [Acidobacteriota bacterium]
MTKETTRRDILKSGLALAGVGLLGIPEWALPALAQGETLVPFTDLPDNINWVPAADRRLYDVRTIDGVFTPRDKWFTTQHYGHPDIAPAAYRLKVSGMVERPLSLSLDELKKMRSTDLVFGFECSGNRRPIQGLSSNGRWTGVPLREVLNRAGVKDDAREFVFFGADHGDEDVEFRGNTFKVDQQFGRSLPREKALSGEPILAYALGGEPLTRHQGFPVRLLVPGYYGVCNVKFLAEIHAQHDPYLGKYQARWYRTLRGETINGQVHWKEDAVTHMQLKSWIARVTNAGNRHHVFGIVLNDGTPIRTVEVSIDGGPWQAAKLDPETMKEKCGWKLFTYAWMGATPGEHTLVSRVIDVNGQVQPTSEEIANKKTFLEDNSQHPRKVMIA